MAVLDTGLGRHPWFPTRTGDQTAETCADRQVPRRAPAGDLRGRRIGVWKEPSRDPENTGVIIDDVNGLVDVLCGHGTFIAGIIRQRCPEAVILAVPVMASDGAALEDDIVTALSLLLERHRAAKAAPGTITHGVLDVLNLSFGYYHETPGSFDDESALMRVLRALSAAGVAVVAAAGNSSSDLEFYPAAFSGRNDFDIQLVSVGSKNPDRMVVSLYSNTGSWVRTYRPGTAVVSTLPETFNASSRQQVLRLGTTNPARGLVDDDDFSTGFGVWSGTSFAAPAFAADVAQQLATAADPAARSVPLKDVKQAEERRWRTPRTTDASMPVVAHERPIAQRP